MQWRHTLLPRPCHKGMAARVVKVLEATLMACIGLRLGTCVCLAPVSQASQGTALTLQCATAGCFCFGCAAQQVWGSTPHTDTSTACSRGGCHPPRRGHCGCPRCLGSQPAPRSAPLTTCWRCANVHTTTIPGRPRLTAARSTTWRHSRHGGGSATRVSSADHPRTCRWAGHPGFT